MSAPPNLPKPHLLIDMIFDSQPQSLGVEKIEADGYCMDKDGNIALLKVIKLGSYGLIRFRIDPSQSAPILSFVGLKLAKLEKDLEHAEILLDTGGAYFGDSPFQVRHEQDGSMFHLNLQTFSQMDTSILDIDWFYTVGVWVAGHAEPIWLDPRIHNKGENL